jgi:dihydrofolate synthase / folylpolyglutamate synthase
LDVALSDYREALDYLFARTTGVSRLGLERTAALSRSLGEPHQQFHALHVAGTNGKGSVAATLEALLRARGLRVGKYTSPHLVDFRERIVVDGQPVSERAVVEFIERWTPEVERLGATFFEATTVMAFEQFARARVDIAVVEVGLGGRLDATNVLTPLAAGVTSIGFDHMEYLGETLEEIAGEKAGIFKPGIPAAIGERDERIRRRLAELAQARGARPIRVVADAWDLGAVSIGAAGTTFTLGTPAGRWQLTTPLCGAHQASNAALALAMLADVADPFRVSPADANRALATVSLPGRFQRVGRYIFDVAHNVDGAVVLGHTLAAVAPGAPVVAVLCVLRDKDWRGMMRALAPYVTRFVLTDAPSAPASRAWDVDAAAVYARSQRWSAGVVRDFAQALDEAAAHGATVLITGSFHTVGDAMARLQVAPLGA